MVPGEFTQAYNRFAPTLQRLQARCDLLLGGVAREVGSRFTGSRIKKVESLLLKTEKDGPGDPFKDSEDLYAATIVVPNETLIPALEEQIKTIFEIKDRRAQRTRRPEEFIYDDLHFILQLKPEPAGLIQSSTTFVSNSKSRQRCRQLRQQFRTIWSTNRRCCRGRKPVLPAVLGR